ncbi:MAG: ribosomal protein S18-alanine N-acetyltransferase [Carnobacterium sp.]|uniref:Ribosomal protein S18-alanine N-acetyltransferase n=1 Tax=Carnobacterium antarcticum TaxID=2126436 RepID=A0ABW4NPY5_9LACT|nr:MULTISPECIES: ribosomal protein S18-alanine N-acetyltransferase [unclassified Carnobacterium]ALV22682.1 Ribosomal-protein-S18p-alanine acetyltransferase [Carnobacterium sp. CP1]QQP70583.1 ribosomal protein S18-alanine N-acetyltransferase [Carnobacterium sp. CS13]
MLKKFREWFAMNRAALNKAEGQSWPTTLANRVHLSTAVMRLEDDQAFQWFVATDEDIPDIVRIQELSYNGSAPWNKKALEHEINHNTRALYLIVRDQERPLAFIGAWFVEEEAHITNIAVVPAERNKGIALRLMKEMMQLAQKEDMVKVSLEVRVSNVAAQHLYRKLGFKDGKVKKEYYAGDHEDALEMSLLLRKRDSYEPH